MKKHLFVSLLACFGLVFSLQAQTVLQEVITDYSTIRNKNKVVEVTIPAGAIYVFYRITTFQTEKVNTAESLFNALRVVSPAKLEVESYDFSKHLLASNTESGAGVFFFNDMASVKSFQKGEQVAAPCSSLENAKSATGKLPAACNGNVLYVGLRPAQKGQPMTVKVEIVAFAPAVVSSSNDKYPFSIQNETDTELVYEVSGSRTNWDTFHLPAARKAEFKLASTPVYFRVSTEQGKKSEEYQLNSGKKYRLYWNKNKQQVDLGEMPK